MPGPPYRPNRPPWRDRSDTAWFLRWLLASWRGRSARRAGPAVRPADPPAF